MEGAATSGMTAIYTGLTAFASAMMGVWGSVVEFISKPANDIALIGVFAFLFVMGVKGIRSLITGV